jgi:hypothetical protein
MRSITKFDSFLPPAVNSNTEYLLFDHLQKIIMTNWIDVFQPLFGEQGEISLRLKELESIEIQLRILEGYLWIE